MVVGMDIFVQKPKKPLKGTIRPESDKSITQRLILFSLLTEEECCFYNISTALDPLSTLKAANQLGLEYRLERDTLYTKGVGLKNLKEPIEPVDCGNSGTLIRFLMGLLSGSNIFAVLSGDSSLNQRPMSRVANPLKEMGAIILGRQAGNYAPLAIQGSPLKGKKHLLKVPSAQLKSALILAGLSADSPTTIVEPIPSRDHTERLLKAMGVEVKKKDNIIEVQPTKELRGLNIEVSGDFSAAAFFIGAGLLVENSEITLDKINLNPTRTGLLRVLQRMGANISKEQKEGIEPSGTVFIHNHGLRGTTVTKEELPSLIDEIPLLAVIAANSEGETVIQNAGELRLKESDRLLGIMDLCSIIGREATLVGDDLYIKGQIGDFNGGVYDPKKDHRLVMAAAIAGLNSPKGILVKDADYASVSQPSFFPQLKELGAEIETGNCSLLM